MPLESFNYPVSFTKTEILPKIYHLHFQDQHELAATFLRFQEYYESPAFKGKIFTVEEFAQWYKTSRGVDKFTYLDDWDGFNIPSYTLEPFYQNKFSPLTICEQQLLNAFSKEFKCLNKFYVIGTAVEDPTKIKSTLKHEVVHAIFYLYPQYRKAVLRILEPINWENFEQILLEKGYSQEVVMDEIHACILANDVQLNFQEPRIGELIIKRLADVFNSYLKYLKSKTS